MKFIGLVCVLTMLFVNTSELAQINNNVANNSIHSNSSSADNNYIDNETFKYIKDCYNDIDFSSSFNKGDTTFYDQYKEKFIQLLNCKIKFTDKNNKKYYINEYGELKWVLYDPSDYIYYFFDADNDNTPELCITDETRFIYIMKYKSESNEIVLWHETQSTWTRLLGSGKLWFYSGTSPVYYAFYQLDENGDVNRKIMFYVNSGQNGITYMLTLPFENSQVPRSIQEQAIKMDSGFYYTVNEEQWNELTADYFKNKSITTENIKEVRFTYKQLFNDII